MTVGIFAENTIIPSWKAWKRMQVSIATLLQQNYKGEGTDASPYVTEWLDDDIENPMTWKDSYKWFLMVIVSFATLAVAFASSA
ncbi:unnamed protein product [Didymodactylos carnosus]|nr:unnamed protein product [Didymodactylos carnosus]CAF3827043.1 unnamed protein product [Didymodactylos carnosus]